MLREDLEILKKILMKLNFSEKYISIISNYLVERLREYKFDNFTPQFLKVQLSPEVGKNMASDISEYFEEMKVGGIFKTKLEKFLDNSPYMK